MMHQSRTYGAPRRAISAVEVVMATLMTGLTLAASLSALSFSVSQRNGFSDRSKGELLANQLLTEILNEDYVDSDSPVFGTETGESTRLAYDDVDDYNGWSASPPQNRDGTNMTNGTGWQRSVTVTYTTASDLTVIPMTDSGLKKITVTVSKNGTTMATTSALRGSEYTP